MDADWLVSAACTVWCEPNAQTLYMILEPPSGGFLFVYLLASLSPGFGCCQITLALARRANEATNALNVAARQRGVRWKRPALVNCGSAGGWKTWLHRDWPSRGFPFASTVLSYIERQQTTLGCPSSAALDTAESSFSIWLCKCKVRNPYLVVL